MDGLNQPAVPDEPLNIASALSAAADVDAQKRLIAKWLDTDRPTALAFWEYVAAQGGIVIGDWHFVAHPKCAEQILLDERQFSVREYDRRMRGTSGRFYLGMDGHEHDTDKKLGEIIPSWNTFQQGAYVDVAALDDVRGVADEATRQVLGLLARNTDIARLTDNRAECRLPLVQLFAPVIDACAAKFFGVPGPSAFSLFLWAKDIALYHFRIQGNDEEDRSPARHSSAEYRAHLLSLIGSLPPKTDPAETEPDGVLGRVVAKLRDELRPCRHARVSDDDVARNLMGIMTGSITATYKAFLEAVLLQPTAADQRISWPEPAPAGAEQPAAAEYCAHHRASARGRASFPHYDAVIAAPLARARRGSLDAIYRRYEGPHELNIEHHKHRLRKHDLVSVWVGGTLPTEPDNLYGIGAHKCPGMDMGKAILDGVLQVLTSLRGQDGPRRMLVDGDAVLVFDNVRALARVANRAYM